MGLHRRPVLAYICWPSQKTNMTVSRLRTFVVCTLLFVIATTANAQRRLNMFTDCECNKTYLKQEIDYVNHTIDPVNAQVNLFIVTSYLSNGGRVYNLDFKGQEELAGNALKFKVSTTSVMTGVERDELLVKRIKLGLAGFLAGTEYGDLVEVEVARPQVRSGVGDSSNIDTSSVAPDGVVETAGVVLSQDNWNNWIFDVWSNASINTESQRSNSRLRIGFRADRTTPDLRIRFNPNLLYRTQSVTQSDGTELTSIRRDMWSNASVVRSISDHWSVGFFNSVSSSTFRNIDYGVWVAPAVEYNFFNYDEVPFKEFTVAYRVGWSYNDYTEETIFLQTSEGFFRQVLDVNLRIRQRWGQVFAGVTAGNFLDDFSKNRFSVQASGNIRLVKGLSFNVSGSYQIINDQISLRRGEASVEDVLLGQSQLATSFEADLSFGLSYTFGSLFNNVINTRL